MPATVAQLEQRIADLTVQRDMLLVTLTQTGLALEAVFERLINPKALLPDVADCHAQTLDAIRAAAGVTSKRKDSK